jgi:hypothetical protein
MTVSQFQSHSGAIAAQSGVIFMMATRALVTHLQFHHAVAQNPNPHDLSLPYQFSTAATSHRAFHSRGHLAAEVFSQPT